MNDEVVLQLIVTSLGPYISFIWVMVLFRMRMFVTVNVGKRSKNKLFVQMAHSVPLPLVTQTIKFLGGAGVGWGLTSREKLICQYQLRKEIQWQPI